MSDIGGSGNSAFDLPFLALQAFAAMFFFAALFALRPGMQGIRAGQAVHALVCVGLPLLWLIAWPSSSGIEGAGRFLVGAPTSLFNGLLGLAWVAVASRRTGQGTWKLTWPSAAAVGACVVVWGVFVAD